MKAKQGQNMVDPIRDPEQIRAMKEYLLHQSYRNYFLFTFGINSGLRISDIIGLRAMDVRNTDHLRMKEKKTGKIRKIRMTGALKQDIEKYTHQMADSDLLFLSLKGQRSKRPKTPGGSLTGLHRPVALQEPSEPIRCAKHLGITFTSKQRTWRCCSRSLAIRHPLSPFGILGLMMKW